MKLLRSFFLVVVFASLLISPSFAYDDDTHYHLTYYLARAVGYTPEQAFRIASANVGIDYAKESEPVQAWKRVFENAGEAQITLIYTHAFMDCRNNPDCLVNDSERKAAVAAVDSIQQQFWGQALSSRNFGGYLHFLQDKYAHIGYSSWGGHWPLSDRRNLDMVLKHLKGEKPLGSGADYLSHTPPEYKNRPVTREEEMIKVTLDAMYEYLTSNLDHQKTLAKNPGLSGEVMDLLARLRYVNPEPEPLVVKDVHIIQDLASRRPPFSDPIAYASWSAEALATLGPRYLALGIKEPPKAPRAYDVVRDAVREFETSYWGGDYPSSYNPAFANFSRLGAYTGDPNAWTLYGDLRIASVTEISGGKKAPAKNVEIRVTIAPVRKQDKDGIALPDKAYSASAVVFEKLPVGSLKVEVLRDGKAVWSDDVRLLETEKRLDIELSKDASDPEGDTDLKLGSLKDTIERAAAKAKELKEACAAAAEEAGKARDALKSARARIDALAAEFESKNSDLDSRIGTLEGLGQNAEEAGSEAADASRQIEFLSYKLCAHIEEILRRKDLAATKNLEKLRKESLEEIETERAKIDAALQKLESLVPLAEAEIPPMAALEEEKLALYREAEEPFRKDMEAVRTALFAFNGRVDQLRALQAALESVLAGADSLMDEINALNTANLEKLGDEYSKKHGEVHKELVRSEDRVKEIRSGSGCAKERAEEAAGLDEDLNAIEDSLLAVRSDIGTRLEKAKGLRSEIAAEFETARAKLTVFDESSRRLDACYEGSKEAIEDPVGHALGRCDFELAEAIIASLSDSEEKKAAQAKYDTAVRNEEKAREFAAEAGRLYHDPGYDAALAKLGEARALTVCPDRQSEIDDRTHAIEKERMMHESFTAALSGPCDFPRAKEFLSYLEARKPKADADKLLEERLDAEKKSAAELESIDGHYQAGGFDQCDEALSRAGKLDLPCRSNEGLIDYWTALVKTERELAAAAGGAIDRCDFETAEGTIGRMNARVPKKELTDRLADRKTGERTHLDRMNLASADYEAGNLDQALAALDSACAALACSKFKTECSEKASRVRIQKGILDNIKAAMADCRFEDAGKLLPGFEPKTIKEALTREITEGKVREKATSRLIKEADDAAESGRFGDAASALAEAEAGSSCERMRESIRNKASQVAAAKTAFDEGTAAADACDIEGARAAAAQVSFKSPRAELLKKISDVENRLSKLRAKTVAAGSSLTNLLNKAGAGKVTEDALRAEADRREAELQAAVAEASTSPGCAEAAGEVVKDTLEMIRRARGGAAADRGPEPKKDEEGPCGEKALKPARILEKIARGLENTGNHAAAAERLTEAMGAVPAECPEARVAIAAKIAGIKDKSKPTINCSGLPNTESAKDAQSEREYCACIDNHVPSRTRPGCIEHPEAQMANSECAKGMLVQWNPVAETVVCVEDPAAAERRRRDAAAAQQMMGSIFGAASSGMSGQNPPGYSNPSGPSMNNAQACAQYREYLQDLCNSGDRSPQTQEIARRTHDSAHQAQCNDPAIGSAYRCVTGQSGY